MMDILIIAGSLFGFLALFPFLARAFARHNLFWTTIKESEGKCFLHNLAFKKAEIRYQNFFLDKRWNVVPNRRRKNMTVEETKSLTESENEKRRKEGKTELPVWDGTERRKKIVWWKKLWERFVDKFMGGGLAFVGIWPFDTVHTYKFRWEAPKEGKPVVHNELLDYAFVKSAMYYTKLEGAETKGMVPLDIGLILTIRIVNLYRALFRAHQWLEFAISRLTPYIRQFIPAKGIEFEKLIGEEQLLSPGTPLYDFLIKSQTKLTPEDKKHLQEDGKTEKEIEETEQSNKGILWILREIYGVDVQGIEFASITTVGKEYETAAAKKWSAERDKERIEIEADAEAKRIGRIYDKIISYGEVGMVLKTLETIKEASNKPGNWILSTDLLHDVKNILRGISQEKKGGDRK